MNRLVLFIHGLMSDTAHAWEAFPELIRQDSDLAEVYTVADFEYSTGAAPAPPSLPEVARDLAVYVQREHSSYDHISIIAHSQGGLVAARYICDILQSGDSKALKVERLLTFGTPHLGSSAASWAKSVGGPQVRNNAVDSDFIQQLGADWQRLAAHERVVEKYVAGGKDSWVSQTSARRADWSDSHEVIPEAGHSSLAKPKTTQARSFKIAKEFLLAKVDAFTRLVKANYTQPPLERRATAKTEENRFHFAAEAIDFMGRDDQLAKLKDMLDPAAGVFRWSVIYGSGGVGKSRLAHELCKITDGEWYSGFLNERDIDRDWRTWQPMMPTLMVVDYASKTFYANPDNSDIAQMINDLANRTTGQGISIARPVRVLLLDRENAGAWLRAILTQGRNTQHLKFPTELKNDFKLETIADPWSLITFVLSAADRPCPPRDEALAKLKELDSECRPLFAHLMADAMLRDPNNWRALDRERLLTDVIDRERMNRWRPVGATAREERGLTLATMAGGVPRTELTTSSDSLLPVWDRDHHPNIFKVMTGADSSEHIPPLEPDIVGEHFVLEMLAADNLDDADRIRLCNLAWDIAPLAMGQFVLRAHLDVPDHELLALLRKHPTAREPTSYWFQVAAELLPNSFSPDAEAARIFTHDIVSRAPDVPLRIMSSFLGGARSRMIQDPLANRLWTALATNKERFFFESAFASPWAVLGFFLTKARERGQTTLVADLYEALAKDMPRLAERAFEEPFKDVGSFLSTAHKHDQTTLVAGLYEALAKDMPRLAERAFEAPLDDLSSFLATARKHDQTTLVAGLYEALAKDMPRLAERAFEAPFDQLSSFLATARKHDQTMLVNDLWTLIGNEPERLTSALTESRPSQLMPLFITIPSELQRVGEAIVSPLEVKFWEFSEYRSARFSTGAPGLALMFGKYGRMDLQDALMNNVLCRKNPGDFSGYAGGILEMSRLLANVPEADEERLAPFIDSVCTPRLLDACFQRETTFSLAHALSTIATCQAPEIVARFWCPGLRRRVSREIAGLSTATPQELSGIVQFLGAYCLAGGKINRRLLQTAPFDGIGRLPSDVLKHKDDSERVDRWQWQLWLGLRTIANLVQGGLTVEKSDVEQTLDLWQANLADTSSKPDCSLRRVNQSMVRWLTRCVNSGDGHLLPDKEPLWVLTGFPIDPRTISVPT